MALKLDNRPRYPYFFCLGLVIVLALWFLFERLHKVEVLITAVAGFISFGVFLYKQHLDETKLFKELFSEFNRRYDKLNLTLNAIKNRSDLQELSEAEVDRVYSYFNLCAEEHLFHKSGYIDEQVWHSWYAGMSIFFKCSRIRALWDAENKETYYGFKPPV